MPLIAVTRKLHRRLPLRRITAGSLAALALALGAIALAPSANADVLFDEDFSGPNASVPFRIGGSFTPCLTASQAVVQKPIPGCPADQPSVPAGGDPAGSGALRLTDNAQRQTGYAVYADALPFTAGIRFLFDAFAYNGISVPGFPGRGADGISVFLRDAAVGADAPGAFGGSLGYAQSNDSFDSPESAPATIPGVPGGYLGIGVDEFGNFANDREARGAGCDPRADRNLHPQTLSLRGRGQPDSEWLRGYCLLASQAAPVALDSVAATARTAPGVARRYLVEVDPPSAPGARVRVAADFDLDGTFTPVLDSAVPPDPPTSFEFGFAASTGMGTNIHELRAVRIETIDPLPKFELVKWHPGQLSAGNDGVFFLRASLRSDGGAARAPVILDDLLPAGLLVRAMPSGEGWDCSATVVGSRVTRCTYEASPQSPIAPGAGLPRVRLPVSVGAHVEGELVNRARLTGAEITVSVRATDRFALRRAADLAVRKIARPEKVAAGEQVSFGLAVTNHGPSDARRVVLLDNLPDGLTLLSAEASEGSCEAVDTGLRCELGTIRVGGTKLVEIVARADGPPGTLINVGVVAGADPDPDPGNNRDRAPVEVGGSAGPNSDLVVEKQASRSTVYVGEALEYVVRVTNRGRGTATDVVLADGNSLPVRMLSMQPSVGSCRLVERLVVCRLGDLAPGSEATVRMRVEILRAGSSRNTVAPLPERADGRHLAHADVLVRDGARLSVSKVADRRSIVIGERVTFHIRVSSLGPQPARRVRVCDQLPPSLKLLRAAGAKGFEPPCWTVAKLDVGKSRTFRLTAQGAAVTNRATNRVVAQAANAGPKRAQRDIRVLFDPCARPLRPAEATISC